jgi:chromosome segregation ATPase
MANDNLKAKKIRKLRGSLAAWRARSAEKQQTIKSLRVKVRDLTTSREQWRTRAKALEQRISVLETAQADALELRSPFSFFGG